MVMQEAMNLVGKFDPEVGAMIRKEYDRQVRNIELIASENIVSEAVLAAMGSVLTNKYAEGYPGKRYYGGCECVDEVENLAIARVCKLFGAQFANVQPHSGAQANMEMCIRDSGCRTAYQGTRLQGGRCLRQRPDRYRCWRWYLPGIVDPVRCV